VNGNSWQAESQGKQEQGGGNAIKIQGGGGVEYVGAQDRPRRKERDGLLGGGDSTASQIFFATAPYRHEVGQ